MSKVTKKIRLAAADALHATREYIEKNGWTKGELVEEDSSRVCFFGGLVFSQGEWTNQDYLEETVMDHPEMMEAAWLMADLVATEEQKSQLAKFDRRSYAPVNVVIRWNDDDDQTEQEVLDAIAKAEKIARAGFDPDA